MKIKNSILKHLFPERCVGCNSYPHIICNQCIQKLTNAEEKCYICKTDSENFKTHYNCTHNNSLNNLFINFSYSPTIEKLVISLKYDFYYLAAEEIAKLIKNSPNTPDLTIYDIIPVPIHWKRKNQRGFNQNEKILNELNKLYGKTLKIKNCLEKLKFTEHQLGHSKKEREQNIKYSINFKPEFHDQLNNPILIFDDICTTGSTLNECVRALKEKSTHAEISALVLSRG